jgi:hypothetical protein
VSIHPAAANNGPEDEIEGLQHAKSRGINSQENGTRIAELKRSEGSLSLLPHEARRERKRVRI